MNRSCENVCSRRIPITGWIGLLTSVCAVALWVAEQLTERQAIEMATIPFKLAVLLTPMFFYRELSAFLYERTRVAVLLVATLVGLTMLAAAAYLPWRDAFATHFNNDSYRWYYSGAAQFSGFGDVAGWDESWNRRVPHLIEMAILMAYYGSIVTVCTVWRLGMMGSIGVGWAGYAILFYVPIATRLIIWDYDNFLRGIIFDSISMDLTPILFWYAGDFSIFLYVFMVIFFGVCAGYMYAWPRNHMESGAPPERATRISPAALRP